MGHRLSAAVGDGVSLTKQHMSQKGRALRLRMATISLKGRSRQGTEDAVLGGVGRTIVQDFLQLQVPRT